MNAFKNAFKVIAAKFGFLWTHIVYYSLVLLIMISISLTVLIPYINSKTVEEINVAQSLSAIGQSLIDKDGFSEFIRLSRDFVSELGSVFSGGNWFQTISLLFLLSLVTRFVLGLADIAFFHCVDMHLSSAAKKSFRASFVKNLSKSAKYQLCKMLFALPADAAIVAVIYAVSLTFGRPLFLFFAPFFMVLAFVILYSLRLTLLSGWAPEILHSENKKIFPALFKSFKLCHKNFARNYGTMFLYVLVAIAINIFFGLFTLGVGLFVTIPFTFYLLTVLSSTLYYDNNNLRYYIDKNTIIN